MCKRIDERGTPCRPARATRGLGGAWPWLGVGVVGLTIGWPGALAASQPGDDAAAAAAEGSVLVASRTAVEADAEAASTTATDQDADVEATSPDTAGSPQLAEDEAPREGDAARFGRALAKLAAVPKPVYEEAAAQLDSTAAEPIAPEPAKFKAIQPGTSTKADVLEAWDEPAETVANDEGQVLVYQMEPFAAVEVLLTDDIVSAIKIEMSGSLTPQRLARQLSLGEIESTVVTDDQGAALGEVYPERGVLFMYRSSESDTTPVAATTPVAVAPTVRHVVIQPLDANAFTLRAEQRLHGPYEQNIDDLKFALSLDPELGHAHWLLAEIYLINGQADQAEDAANAACELEPENAAFRLRRARARRLLGRYDEATREVRSVLDRDDAPRAVRARALHEMGQLASLGEESIADKAIAFENSAIELADTLATSANLQERRAAKELLVEAHLAIARSIASHSYSNKRQSVSQWIGRASGLAEDFITHDGGSLELRLLVAREALAALASFKPSKDPTGFVTEAREAAEALAQQHDDMLWQRRIQWELGQAYVHAVRIEHLRLQSAAALRYGQLAIENLADGAETRQAVHASEQLVGQLYFQIGAIHAVHKEDHQTAVEWYEKAVPLLTAPRPFSELLTPQRDGEQLVSIGLSYWHVDQRDQAIDLTLSGAELVQQAVDSGILTEESLAVPYGNLASMYQQLGEVGDAAKYAELARVAAADTSSAANRRATRSGGKAGAGPGHRRVNQASSSARRRAQYPAHLQPVRRSTTRPSSSPLH